MALAAERASHGGLLHSCCHCSCPCQSNPSSDQLKEANSHVPLPQAKRRRQRQRQRRPAEGAAREYRRSSSGARAGAGDRGGRSGGALPCPSQRGVPGRRVRRPRRELRARGQQLRRQDGAAQRQRGARAAPQRARHVLQARHVARHRHGGAPHERRRGPRRARPHPRRRVHRPPLRWRRRRLVAELQRGVVAPRRPGKPSHLHRDRARVGGARGERGHGEVRGEAAPGGAVHGSRGDERQRVVADGTDVRRAQPPAREHPGRHLRSGAPGLRLPQRGAGAVGVQHHPSGLRGRAAVGSRDDSQPPVGKQRPGHDPLGRAGAGAGAGPWRGGRARRRGGRRLQAHDGRHVPCVQQRAQGIHHHRQGQEELGSLAQEGVRGAVRLQPGIPVRVVRQVRLRGRRACHAGACDAGGRRYVAGGSVPAQPQSLGAPLLTDASWE